MPSPIIPLVGPGGAGIVNGAFQNVGSVFADPANNRVSSFSPANPQYFNVNNYTTGALVSSTLVGGTLTTNGVTASGNNTLHFVSVPAWIIAGLKIEDATNETIVFGTTVLSTTSTTVVMSANATGIGTQSGSVIQFGNPSFFAVSGNTCTFEEFPCSGLGTDGYVYVRSTRNAGISTINDAACRISKIDPAAHVEVAIVQPTSWASFTPSIITHDVCGFKLAGVNYIALVRASELWVINVDTMANAVNGVLSVTISALNGYWSVVSGTPSGSTIPLYIVASTPVSGTRTAYLLLDVFNATGNTLTPSTIKTYAPTDFNGSWTGSVNVANAMPDQSDGNVICWVRGEGSSDFYYTNYIVKLNHSTGVVVWKVQVPSSQTGTSGLDWSLATLPKQSDLSAGTFGYAINTEINVSYIPPYGPGLNASGNIPAWMSGQFQAAYIEINTTTGSFTTKNDDNLYLRGYAPSFWDSTNRKLLYWNMSATTYPQGYTLFLPDNSAQTTPWTRTVFNPFWTNGPDLYDFPAALARDPRQPNEVFVWGYQSVVPISSALTPHAVAVYNTSTGALARAAVVDSSQYGSNSIANIANGGAANYADNDPLIIAPNSRKLFYFHVGEINPPSSFPTTRWFQEVNADTLTLGSASQTPSAASAAAPWVAGGPYMLSGPLTLIASNVGSYVFATWYYDSGTNDTPFALWQTSGATTRYGTLNADVVGFDPTNYDFTRDNITFAVFDGTGRLWLSCKNFTLGYDELIVCTISGVTLTQVAVYSFDATNFGVYGLQYDPVGNQVVVSYNSPAGRLTNVRVDMTGTVGTPVASSYNPANGPVIDTNAFFGSWMNGSDLALPQDSVSSGVLPDNIISLHVIDQDHSSFSGSGGNIWSLHGLDTNLTPAIEILKHTATGAYPQGPKVSDFGEYLGSFPFLAPAPPVNLTASTSIQLKGRLVQPAPTPPPPPPPPPTPPNPFNCMVPVISQYANSPILLTILENFCEAVDPWGLINEFYNFLWNIDTARGYGLDVWGRIVGVTRVLSIAQGRFFGFEEQLNTTDPFNVSPFFAGTMSGSNYLLSDDAFRLLILVKALANITDGSTKSINTILRTLFTGSGNAYVVDGLNMTMQYTFSFPLSPVQAAIINQSGVLPRSTGVSATVSVP